MAGCEDVYCNVYKITAGFPVEEKFGFTNQIRRASVSIVAIITEGSGRVCPKDQAHFYQVACSSKIEVLSHLLIAFDLKFIDEKNLSVLRLKLEELTNKVNAPRNSSLRKV